jgi:hypothetical protein
MTAANKTTETAAEEPRKTLAEWYAMFEENGGDLMTDSAIERLKGGNMTAATTTEAAPFSVEEMRELISRLGPITGLEYARAIATAVALEEAVAALERLTNWILTHERDAGVKLIPALETVREALADPVERPANDASKVLVEEGLKLFVRTLGGHK